MAAGFLGFIGLLSQEQIEVYTMGMSKFMGELINLGP